MKNDYSQLLIDVQKKSNITVADIKDVTYLKEEIETVVSAKISFNTLRRLFGFLPKTKPAAQTLNILANYLGFNSFSNYKNNKTNYEDWYFQQYLIQLWKQKKLSSEAIETINLGIENENNLIYLGYFLAHHIEKNHMQLTLSVFKAIRFQTINRTQLHKFGIILYNSLALIPEKQALQFYGQLVPLADFRENVPLLNIDYTHLHGRYFQIIQLIAQNKANDSDVFFTALMGQYKAFYIDGKNVEQIMPVTKPKDFDALFVTLKGRYFGMRFLLEPAHSVAIKNEIRNACKTVHISFFLIEIIPALIFKEAYDFLEELLDSYYEEVFEGEVWSSETTNAIYLIGLSTINWQRNNFVVAKRNLELIDLSRVEIGYVDYVALFYHLIALQISQSENNKKANAKALKTLQQLIKKTKFIRFEEKAARFVLR